MRWVSLNLFVFLLIILINLLSSILVSQLESTSNGSFLFRKIFNLMINLYTLHQHCSNHEGATRPLLLVTASVDRMVLKKPIRVDTDLKIVGAVTWVGRSSMEIRLEVIQPIEGNWHTWFKVFCIQILFLLHCKTIICFKMHYIIWTQILIA